MNKLRSIKADAKYYAAAAIIATQVVVLAVVTVNMVKDLKS